MFPVTRGHSGYLCTPGGIHPRRESRQPQAPRFHRGAPASGYGSSSVCIEPKFCQSDVSPLVTAPGGCGRVTHFHGLPAGGINRFYAEKGVPDRLGCSVDRFRFEGMARGLADLPLLNPRQGQFRNPSHKDSQEECAQKKERKDRQYRHLQVFQFIAAETPHLMDKAENETPVFLEGSAELQQSP